MLLALLLLAGAWSVQAQTKLYNLRIGAYAYEIDGSDCDDGEDPDPRYTVSMKQSDGSYGPTMTINPGDDVSCGINTLSEALVLSATPIDVSSASPFVLDLQLTGWEEDGCGGDSSYDDDCFLDDDDAFGSTTSINTINPDNYSPGTNTLRIEFTGSENARYILIVQWEMHDETLVTMYRDADQSGTQQAFGSGEFTTDALGLVGNNQISSMQIAAGYKVIAYLNDNFASIPKVFRGTVSNVGAYNDEISSFKVVVDDGEPSNETLLIYFNGSGKALDHQLTQFATRLKADKQIYVNGVGSNQKDYSGFNQNNIRWVDDDVIAQYAINDLGVTRPITTFGKTFKNDNHGGGDFRYVIGIDREYDGSVAGGYEDEDSKQAVFDVLFTLARYDLKAFDKIIISGHSRGSAVGIASFLFGVKEAWEGNGDFAGFQSLVQEVFGNANTINVVALDPVAGQTGNDYHMGDDWNIGQAYSWFKSTFSNVEFAEVYANGAKQLEADELGGLGEAGALLTFNPARKYLHDENDITNQVHRYWLGFRHSSMVNRPEKLFGLYDHAGVDRPFDAMSDFLNAAIEDQTLFTNCSNSTKTFETIDQEAWLAAKELYPCEDEPGYILDPNPRQEISYFHSKRHTDFQNNDDVTVDMDDFINYTGVSLNCSEVYDLPTAPGLYTAEEAHTDQDGWTFYCTCQGKLLLALRNQGTGADIPTNGVSLNIGNTKASYLSNGTGFITNPSGAVVMNRTWNVNPTTQPTSDVAVQFFFTKEEYDAVNTELSNQSLNPLTSPEQLWFYKATSGDAHAAISDIPSAIVLTKASPNFQYSTTSWGLWEQKEDDYYAVYDVSSFSGGGGGGASNGGTALPVELLEFYGKVQPNGIALHWTTASEQNNAGFELQRSRNGQQWQTLDFIKGNGTTVEMKSYHWLDQNPLSGINYYRLKQIDLDDTWEYSPMISVQVDRKQAQEELLVFPNPVTNLLHYQLPDMEQVQGVQLLDVTGQVLRATTVIDGQLSLNGLPSGMYLLVLDTATGRLQQRIMKQ